MPEDMHFDHTSLVLLSYFNLFPIFILVYLICKCIWILLLLSGDCWVSEDETVEIREGTLVRLRIIGLTIDAEVIVRWFCYYVVCIVVIGFYYYSILRYLVQPALIPMSLSPTLFDCCELSLSCFFRMLWVLLETPS